MALPIVLLIYNACFLIYWRNERARERKAQEAYSETILSLQSEGTIRVTNLTDEYVVLRTGRDEKQVSSLEPGEYKIVMRIQGDDARSMQDEKIVPELSLSEPRSMPIGQGQKIQHFPEIQSPTTAVVGPRIYLFGGRPGTWDFSDDIDIKIYDPERDAWVPRSNEQRFPKDGIDFLASEDNNESGKKMNGVEIFYTVISSVIAAVTIAILGFSLRTHSVLKKEIKEQQQATSTKIDSAIETIEKTLGARIDAVNIGLEGHIEGLVIAQQSNTESIKQTSDSIKQTIDSLQTMVNMVTRYMPPDKNSEK